MSPLPLARWGRGKKLLQSANVFRMNNVRWPPGANQHARTFRSWPQDFRRCGGHDFLLVHHVRIKGRGQWDGQLRLNDVFFFCNILAV